MRGETAADDYVVIWDDLRIGRIYKTGRRLERFRTVKPSRPTDRRQQLIAVAWSLRMRFSPSSVPLDHVIYLVLHDLSARAGCACRETDETDAGLENILGNLLSGQYGYPVRIVCFNPAKAGHGTPPPTSLTPLVRGRHRRRDPVRAAGIHRYQRHETSGHKAGATSARCRPWKERRAGNWRSRSEADHFIRCTICGERFDMRDLSKALDHLHGQEIEEIPHTCSQ